MGRCENSLESRAYLLFSWDGIWELLVGTCMEAHHGTGFFRTRPKPQLTWHGIAGPFKIGGANSKWEKNGVKIISFCLSWFSTWFYHGIHHHEIHHHLGNSFEIFANHQTSKPKPDGGSKVDHAMKSYSSDPDDPTFFSVVRLTYWHPQFLIRWIPKKTRQSTNLITFGSMAWLCR